MSLGGRRFPYWWDPSTDLKKNINRDLKKNDRLCVASAGNRGKDPVPSRRYPAAFDNVLGVSGLITTRDGSSWYDQYTFYNGIIWGSNYYPDSFQTYPVSGIYDFVNLETRYQDPVGYSLWGNPPYEHFNGTSAAAPQVSALARQLCGGRSWATYRDVWNRIVSTRDDTKARGHIAGLVNYSKALEGW